MSDGELLAAVERELGDATPTASVIWLHGLGADGHDFADVPPYLELPADLPVRFVFPHAPRIPVTLNAGMVMPAWYDIRALDERGHDEAGIRRSAEQIEALTAREKERGIPASRIVLGGFSQGGAMALHVGLRHRERLAGVAALSAYLLLHQKLAAEAADANRDVPIFQAHGTHDPMVPHALGRRSAELLREHGWEVEWHEYPMAHQVVLEELQALGRWLAGVLAPDA